MTKSPDRKKAKLAKVADRATKSIGSMPSLFVHSVIFGGSFLLPVFGVVPFEQMLLILTTALSLEAIYLAIFIQMSVNKNTEDIEDIQEDVEEIQEDIEEIEEDVGEIQKDVDEIQEDIEEIEKDVDEIQEDIEEIEEDEKAEDTQQQKEFEALASIQEILTKLQGEIEQLKQK
ncbi:MAG TPA: hypothetical protein VGE18_00970 [Candidatus Paceibacterota bacterium]